MEVLNKLYDEKNKLETEIKIIRKQINNAKRSEKRIEQKIINKKIEEQHIEQLLKIKDDRRSAKKNNKQKTLSAGEGESDRGTTTDKRLPLPKDNQRIQEGGREDRPKRRKEKRPQPLDEGTVDPSEAIPGKRGNNRLRRKQGGESVPTPQKNRQRDSYYIARTNRKSREEDPNESSETEGSESSDANEMD
jgi:hypothetical protein